MNLYGDSKGLAGPPLPKSKSGLPREELDGTARRSAAVCFRFIDLRRITVDEGTCHNICMGILYNNIDAIFFTS